VEAEPVAVGRLIDRCARLPLALAIVAARAAVHRGLRLTALADEIGAADGLDAFATGESGMDVRTVLSWSYHALAPEAAALFRGLASQPGPDASVALAASVAGVSERAVRPLLRDLVGAHLITEHQPGRFVFHDLLRAYAGELSRHTDDAGSRDAATRRMLDHYLHTAVAQAIRMNPYRAPIELAEAVPGTVLLPSSVGDPLAWFDAERDALLAAVAVADSLGLDARVWQFVWALTPYLQDRRCYWDESTALATLALASAIRDGDKWWTGYLRNTLGRGYLRMGRYAESRAQYEQAITIGHDTGNPLRLAHAYAGIAAGVIESDAELTPEQTAETEELLAEAASLYRSIGSSHGEADVEQYLADLFMRDPATLDQAGPHIARSAALFRELDTQVGDAFAHVFEARRDIRDGDFRSAISHLQEAIGMYTETFVRARCTAMLAECYDRVGDPAAASELRQAALDLLDGFDNPAVARLRESVRAGTVIQPRSVAGSGSLR
jgi:tetratricopeptide (TPR) repeat protein